MKGAQGRRGPDTGLGNFARRMSGLFVPSRVEEESRQERYDRIVREKPKPDSRVTTRSISGAKIGRRVRRQARHFTLFPTKVSPPKRKKIARTRAKAKRRQIAHVRAKQRAVK